MADYFAHWLKIGKTDGIKLPKVFYVNWFRKDDDGKFLWPGFGENSRVLEWVFRRCAGRGRGDRDRDRPAADPGRPQHRRPRDLRRGAAGAAHRRRGALPRSSCPQVKEHLAKFGDKLPAEVSAQLDALERAWAELCGISSALRSGRQLVRDRPPGAAGRLLRLGRARRAVRGASRASAWRPWQAVAATRRPGRGGFSRQGHGFGTKSRVPSQVRDELHPSVSGLMRPQVDGPKSRSYRWVFGPSTWGCRRDPHERRRKSEERGRKRDVPRSLTSTSQPLPARPGRLGHGHSLPGPWPRPAASLSPGRQPATTPSLPGGSRAAAPFLRGSRDRGITHVGQSASQRRRSAAARRSTRGSFLFSGSPSDGCGRGGCRAATR